MLKQLSKILCLCLLSFTLFACNDVDFSALKNNSPVKLSGKLVLVGNAPFEKIAIRSKEYKQTLPLIFKHPEDKESAQENLGKQAKIKGVLRIQDIQTADLKKTFKKHLIVVHKIKL